MRIQLFGVPPPTLVAAFPSALVARLSSNKPGIGGELADAAIPHGPICRSPSAQVPNPVGYAKVPAVEWVPDCLSKAAARRDVGKLRIQPELHGPDQWPDMAGALPGMRSLLCLQLYPVRQRNFPAIWRRELASKGLHYSVFRPVVGSPSGHNRQIPCKILCLQGICLETGANSTASPATHSSVLPGFPRDRGMGWKSRLFAHSLWSWNSRRRARFCDSVDARAVHLLRSEIQL